MKRIKQFFRHHRLSREWRIVRHPAAILAMNVVRLEGVEYLADKRAIKDRFIQFGPIRNESDGRTVVIPASSAGKMLGASGVDIRRLAAAADSFRTAKARRMPFGIFSSPMGKFSRLRWVCAPQSRWAGTAISPMVSRSIL